MRFVLIIAACLVSPSVQADVVDQFAVARSVFGTSDPAAIIDGIDGDWVELLGYSQTLSADSTPDAVRRYAESFIAMSCDAKQSKAIVHIETWSDHGFTTRRASQPETTTRYNWIESRPIAVYAPTFLRTTHGAEKEAYRPAPHDGQVTIYRPASEILVMHETDGKTAIWGRCSAYQE